MSLASPPIVDYKSITINNQEIALSGSYKVSFQAPYNNVHIKMRPDVSLSIYEVRVTQTNEEYDLGIGTLPVRLTNVPADKDTEFDISVSAEFFYKGDGAYRVSLYAQNAIDYSWDVTYILMVLQEGQVNLYEQFIPTDSDAVELKVVKPIDDFYEFSQSDEIVTITKSQNLQNGAEVILSWA